MAEQLICNQQVDGSTPFTSSSDIRRQSPPKSILLYGSVPEWPKGTDCKSAGNAFGGPNPPAPTNKWARLSCLFLLVGGASWRRTQNAYSPAPGFALNTRFVGQSTHEHRFVVDGRRPSTANRALPVHPLPPTNGHACRAFFVGGRGFVETDAKRAPPYRPLL